MSLSEVATLLWDIWGPNFKLVGNPMRSTASSRFFALMSVSALVFALASAPFYASQAAGDAVSAAQVDHDLRLGNLVAEARVQAVSIDGP